MTGAENPADTVSSAILRGGGLSAAALLSALFVWAGPRPTTVAAGLLLAFVLPGAAVASALLRGPRLSGVERIILVPALSMAVLVLGGLALNVCRVRLTEVSWTALTVSATILGAAAGVARSWRTVASVRTSLVVPSSPADLEATMLLPVTVGTADRGAGPVYRSAAGSAAGAVERDDADPADLDGPTVPVATGVEVVTAVLEATVALAAGGGAAAPGNATGPAAGGPVRAAGAPVAARGEGPVEGPVELTDHDRTRILPAFLVARAAQAARQHPAQPAAVEAERAAVDAGPAAVDAGDATVAAEAAEVPGEAATVPAEGVVAETATASKPAASGNSNANPEANAAPTPRPADAESPADAAATVAAEPPADDEPTVPAAPARAVQTAARKAVSARKLVPSLVRKPRTGTLTVPIRPPVPPTDAEATVELKPGRTPTAGVVAENIGGRPRVLGHAARVAGPLLAAVLVLGFAGVVSATTAQAQASQTITALSAVPVGTAAAVGNRSILVDLASGEPATTRFTVRVVSDGITVGNYTATLRHGDRWTRTVAVPIGTVTVALYRAGDTSPLREVYLEDGS